MSSKSPTLIVITGAWIHYDVYVEGTKSLTPDYPVVVVNRPTTGMHPASTDMSEDITAIRKAVTEAIADEGEVVLVMHSIAAIVTAESVIGLTQPEREKEGKRGGIIGNIYIAAVQAPVGSTQLEYILPWFDAKPERASLRETMTHGEVYAEVGLCTVQS